MTDHAVLDVFDTYTYFLLSPISMGFSFMLILAHLWYRELREKPGDLILMIAICEFFLSIHYTGSAIYTNWLINRDYEDDSWFCISNSYLSVAAATGSAAYDFCLLILIWYEVRADVSRPSIKQWYFHVFALGVVGSVVGLKAFFGQLGRNINGTCSTTLDLRDFITLSYFTLAIMILSIVVTKSAKKQIAMEGDFQVRVKRDFLNYYEAYIKTFLLITVLYFLSNLIQIIVKLANPKKDLDKLRDIYGQLLLASRIANSFKVTMPTLMFFIRIKDPLLASVIFRPLRKDIRTVISEHQKERQTQRDNLMLALKTEGSENYKELSEMSKRWRDELVINEEVEGLGWINLMSKTQKENFARTFVAVLMKYFERGSGIRDSVVKSFHSDHDGRKVTGNIGVAEDSKESISFSLNGKKMMDHLSMRDAILDCDVTMYAPSLFGKVVDTCPKKIDFGRSLNLLANADEIRKCAEKSDKKQGGGASGELFITTHDRQLLIKTIKESEVIVFKQFIKEYANYLAQNQKSQICRKFALVKIFIKNLGKSVFYVLMENLFPFEKTGLRRVYDIKGSQYSRKVFKDDYSKFAKEEPYGKTLKETDFINIDQKLSIKNQAARDSFISQITEDSKFFLKHKIMDYSLVFFITKKEPLMGGLEGDLSDWRIIELEDSELVIVTGIIDYFQRYNFSKAFERFWKRVTNCKPNLQTSSQPPDIYSSRFINFIALHV